MLGSLLVLAACKKDDSPNSTPDTNLAYVSFTNVNSSSKTLTVFVDQKQVNPTAIAVNSTLLGVYAGVEEGSRALVIRDAVPATPPVDYYTGTINVEKGKSYSFFQYGVLTGGALKGILLNTDRTSDNTGAAKVRFLNISNGAPALDFVMVRREGTTEKDSVVIGSAAASLASIATPDIAALSAYKVVAANRAANATPGVAVSSYNLKLKLAGTNTLVGTSITGATILPGKNYTYYARGNYPAVALTAVADN